MSLSLVPPIRGLFIHLTLEISLRPDCDEGHKIGELRGLSGYFLRASPVRYPLWMRGRRALWKVVVARAHIPGGARNLPRRYSDTSDIALPRMPPKRVPLRLASKAQKAPQANRNWGKLQFCHKKNASMLFVDLGYRRSPRWRPLSGRRLYKRAAPFFRRRLFSPRSKSLRVCRELLGRRAPTALKQSSPTR